ncbi:hypothetical protein OS493_019654 [Desmophyllum pertusum]|uniref:Uncharacterized protein n=1 Tax=Desmophyllum pertusum TaxID=174260 RepID=A0A9W9ZCS4_9CNID|nr:hypothetical protein OS493_019654 [Desmophyllum pertusum]
MTTGPSWGGKKRDPGNDVGSVKASMALNGIPAFIYVFLTLKRPLTVFTGNPCGRSWSGTGSLLSLSRWLKLCMMVTNAQWLLVQGCLSDWFDVKFSVKQGYNLLVVDWVMRTTVEGSNTGIRWKL